MKKFVFFLVALMALSPAISSAATMGERLQGKLLLQVEQGGRIWYVAPKDKKRHEVTFENALPLFETHAVGITNDNLNKIRRADQYSTGNAFGKRFVGKLFLQVQDKGRIWYVDFNGLRHEVTWKNLMDLFKKLSLGITNKDLGNIGIGSTTKDNETSSAESDDDYDYEEDGDEYEEDGDEEDDGEYSNYGPDYDPNDYSSHEVSTPDTSSTYTAPTVSTKSPALRLVTEFDALTPTEIVQLYNGLGYNDRTWFDINGAYTELLQFKACSEYPNFITASASFGQRNCTQVAQSLQTALQFSGMQSVLQNADTQRLSILNALNCSNGTHSQASCSAYANTTQNVNNMINSTNERVLMNLNNECYLGVDAGCEYWNTN